MGMFGESRKWRAGHSATSVGVVLVAAALIGFAVFAVLALNTLHAVKIGGPLYNQLALMESVGSDYAPPSEYVIGLRVLVSEMDDSRNPKIVQEKIAKFQDLLKHFEQQHAYYEKNLPAGPIREATTKVYQTAERFIDIAQNDFIPLKLMGRDQEAHDVRVAKAVPAFEAHERANDALMQLLTPEIATREAAARRLVASRTALMLLVALSLPLVVVLAAAITFQHQRTVERAVRASEEKFEVAFRSSPDGIALVDFESGIIEVNDRAKELTGCEPHELLGHNLVELGLLRDASVREEFLRRLRDDGSVRDFPYTIHKKNGEIVQVLCSGALVEFGGGLRAITIHRDITEQVAALTKRQEAEDALRESEARFRAMFEDSGTGMALVDMQGHPVECNPALMRILGYGAEELRAMPFTEFTHLDDRRMDWELYQDLVAGKRNQYEIEKRFIAKDGRTIWGSLVVSIVKDSHGVPKYAVGMVQDITERKHAEEELLRVSERLQLATSAANIGIWDWDVTHDKLVWDDAMYRLFGVQREKFSGAYEAWARRLVPEDLERAQAAVQAALRGERELATEHRVAWPDGSKHFMQAVGRTFRDAAGRPLRMVGAVFDITERRLAEEQLRALSDRLRKAKEEEGIRIARELHDQMGSALTSLKWGLTTLRAEESRSFDTSAARRNKIDEMVETVDGAITAVRRISSELRPGPLDLGLISAIEWHAKQFESESGIVCRLDAEVESVEIGREQATAVYRIFQEAMTNILRHAQASKVTIMVELEENELVLEITDNGRGITDREKSGLNSLGILGMRERAQSIDAKIEIVGGTGTKVIVRVPLREHAAEREDTAAKI